MSKAINDNNNNNINFTTTESKLCTNNNNNNDKNESSKQNWINFACDMSEQWKLESEQWRFENAVLQSKVVALEKKLKIEIAKGKEIDFIAITNKLTQLESKMNIQMEMIYNIYSILIPETKKTQ